MNKNSNNFDVILLGTILDMELCFCETTVTPMSYSLLTCHRIKNIHPEDYELRVIIDSQPSVYYGSINLFVANLQEIKGIKHH